jgi:nucleotidyltransferase substrate binding protein (TIGR01987 family)
VAGLDTSSLANVVRRLREGLARAQAEPNDEQVRDGLIQRFEFTYELSHKMLRRYVMQAAPSPDVVAAMPFADLIRAANAQGLLRGDWPAWRRFREMRGRTSHTCDTRVATEVVAAIPQFLAEAEHLLIELQARSA